MKYCIRTIIGVVILMFAGISPVNAEADETAPVADTVGVNTRHRPRVGVVLCGGGAKGFAHIRILKKIEEAGIPIDYIAGTSIGSIIGGLYAVGYDPDMMEKLVREQDWNTIIYDEIPDRLKPIEQKMEAANYITTLPIKRGKVKVGESFVDGVCVNLLLSRLMLPDKGISDYTKLPVPFFCIGTDMENACEYEMTSGSLSRSIRASMAIPFFFKPVRCDGRVLVDGGMVNNFPVKNMEEKDVDIIIGIDLEDYNVTAENIDNSLSMLTNMMNLSSLEQTEYGRSHCDVYIRPNLHGRTMMSFNDFDSILIYGEQAAELMFPKLKRLGDSIHAIEDFIVERPHAQPVDSLYVVDIKVDGLKDNNDPYIKREFGKVFPRVMSVDDIEAVILRLKASGFYADLWYEVEGAPDDGVLLVLHCTESSNQSFSFDIHYDNDYGIGALVNYSLSSRGNRFKRGSLNVDVNIAESPYLRARVSKRDGRVFRYGTEIYAGYLKLNQYKEKKVTNSFSIQNDKMDIFAQLTSSYIQSFKIGVVGEFFHLHDMVGNVSLNKNYEFYTYMYFNYYSSTEDLAALVKKGWRANITAKCILYEGVFSSFSKRPAWSIQADIMKNVALSENHSLKLGATVDTKLGETALPLPYKFYVGGQSKMKYLDNIIAFDGFNFIEDVTDHILYGKLAWQWNFYKGLYSIVSCNAGFMNDSYDKWFDSGSYIMGAGLTLGLKTFAGPIEVSLMASNTNRDPVGFINIGFWF